MRPALVATDRQWERNLRAASQQQQKAEKLISHCSSLDLARPKAVRNSTQLLSKLEQGDLQSKMFSVAKIT